MEGRKRIGVPALAGVEVHDCIGVQIGSQNELHVHLPPTGAGPVAVVEVFRSEQSPELFVGRTEQVEQLLDALEPADPTAPELGGHPVVVSVVEGMGGVGKTALARHVTTLAVRRKCFQRGYLVNLRGYEPEAGLRVQARDVVASMLREFGVDGTDLPATASEQFVVYHQILARWAAQGRRVLMVLDNASTGEQVEALLPRDREHRVVITTRDTLALPGTPWRLDLDILTKPDAVALLKQIIDELNPGDSRASREPAAVVAVAEACGRLPLAVEIAAALLAEDSDQTIEEFADELAEMSTRLETLRYGEKAVAAVLGLSWHRLVTGNPEAARLLGLLPVNPGPDISTDAAAALAGVKPSRVRPWLRVLRQAHLLRRFDGRWVMHDLVRLDAQARATDLIGADGLESAASRVLDLYLETAEAADGHLWALPGEPVSARFSGRQEALAWLDAERANLVAAVSLAATGGYPRHAADLAGCLGGFLSGERYFNDWVSVSEYADAAARELNDPLRGAIALNNLGLALRNTQRFGEAISVLTQASEIYQDLGDRQREAQVLNNLGGALLEVRWFEKAVTVLTRASEILRKFGDRHGEGAALVNLGIALGELRRFSEAIDVLDLASKIYQNLGDRQHDAKALNTLGSMWLEVRQFDKAIAVLTRGGEIFRDFGDRHGEAQTVGNLGLALAGAGRFDEAITAHTQDLGICRELRDRLGEGGALNNLGVVLLKAGRFDEAITAHTQAREIFRGCGDRFREAQAVSNLGVTLWMCQRADEAREKGVLAAEMFMELDDPHSAEIVKSWLQHLT